MFMPTRPVAIFILLWTTTALAADSSLPAIIPLPQKMERRAGAFELGPKTRIVVDPAARETGQYLANRLRQATGFPLELGTNAETPSVPGGILLTTRAASTNLGTEGYELEIGPDAVVLRAPQSAGLFYGAQSLLQLRAAASR